MDQETPDELPPSHEEPRLPLFLRLTYILLPLWGILWFLLYWNGSDEAAEGGRWQALQEAADTTLPETENRQP